MLAPKPCSTWPCRSDQRDRCARRRRSLLALARLCPEQFASGGAAARARPPASGHGGAGLAGRGVTRLVQLHEAASEAPRRGPQGTGLGMAPISRLKADGPASFLALEEARSWSAVGQRMRLCGMVAAVERSTGGRGAAEAGVEQLAALGRVTEVPGHRGRRDQGANSIGRGKRGPWRGGSPVPAAVSMPAQLPQRRAGLLTRPGRPGPGRDQGPAARDDQLVHRRTA